MHGSVIIRDATCDDAATIVDFNRKMALETEGKSLEVGILSAGVMSVFEDARRGFYVVVEREGVIIGSLLVTTEWSDWRNGVFWWIQSVYIETAFRRQGVFRALYEEIRSRAMTAAGVCGLRLYVERSNAAAQATYRCLGMEETAYRLFEEIFSTR